MVADNPYTVRHAVGVRGYTYRIRQSMHAPNASLLGAGRHYSYGTVLNPYTYEYSRTRVSLEITYPCKDYCTRTSTVPAGGKDHEWMDERRYEQ